MKYNKKIINLFKKTKNSGSIKKGYLVGTGIVGSPACGDVMKLQILVNKKFIIKKARFKTYGCGSAIASSNYLTKIIVGKNLKQVSKISNIEILKYLKLPKIKIHCSILAEQVLKKTIKNLFHKRK
ncbi:iron-sulfur cluster assembly scaffold protein [Candidatus Vidania fulgoroideae]|uniref:Iron-sulfur cluster assembly scaffold protein n=1 Tax=Candidatus Vidania fulgoroideorum TaxID=881286 RepID=A0AAX3N883_9PROT|nr:iron-sulfur cluster assembly scaffold protein [Candidatus Vidania fulgoroideae]